MKRFDVENRQNGMKFSLEREEMPEKHPAWGENPLITVTDTTKQYERTKKRALYEANFPILYKNHNALLFLVYALVQFGFDLVVALKLSGFF